MYRYEQDALGRLKITVGLGTLFSPLFLCYPLQNNSWWDIIVHYYDCYYYYYYNYHYTHEEQFNYFLRHLVVRRALCRKILTKPGGETN